jgi:hypothetical protein
MLQHLQNSFASKIHPAVAEKGSWTFKVHSENHGHADACDQLADSSWQIIFPVSLRLARMTSNKICWSIRLEVLSLIERSRVGNFSG